MTALVTAGLTVWACTTKSDFTDMGGYLYAALLSLVVFGFVGSFFNAFYHTPWIQVRCRTPTRTCLLPCTRYAERVVHSWAAHRTCTLEPDA